MCNVRTNWTNPHLPPRKNRPLARAWRTCGTLGLLVGFASCRPAAQPEHYQIGSSSMAPAILGPTFQATCGACSERFAVASETYQPNLPTRCPSCGGRCSVDLDLIPGEIVTEHPLASTERIGRFDLVAFTVPGQSQPLVKRVWGLPGEHVAIRSGELWIDGALLQKPLEVLQDVCVPVAQFPKDRRSHWTIETSEDQMAIEQAAPGDSDRRVRVLRLQPHQRLCWRYQRPARVHPEQTPPEQWLIPSRIVDDYVLNQGVTRRLHHAGDYLVTVDLSQDLAGTIRLDCLFHEHQLSILFQPAASAEAVDASALAGKQAVSVPCRRKMIIACYDQRLVVRSDITQKSFEWSDLANQFPRIADESPTNPITITCSGPAIAIERLVVSRDLVLTTEPAADVPHQDFGTLPDQSYFLMGDNLPVSVDSRNGLGFISRNRMVGRVRR